MKRICAVLAAILALLVSAGYAAAEPSGGPAAQALSQAAGSGQAAGALSGASQSQPSNGNVSVRVLSPGDNGDVKQSNTVSSSSTAANANVTDQSADQTSGGCGCDAGTQAIGQTATNGQAAQALSLAAQHGASNGNTSVRVASPGDNGSVKQTNSVDSDATAANLNATKQDADQDGGGSGTQVIGQEAKNQQEAGALSAAKQDGASNSNVSVRVLSPGDDGHVSQTNSVDSDATALNLNGTKQDADQDAGGKGRECECSDGIQAIGQESKSEQAAGALSVASQHGASNTNIPVRVASPGDNGSVHQSNSVDSDAKAANLNLTSQDADQDGGSGGIQAVGQTAKNTQEAIALSGAFQIGASNSNTPVRVDSKGDDGRVSQSNDVDSDATAENVNLTGQEADQDAHGGKACDCHGSDGIQAIGQESKSDQGALAGSLAVQAAGHDRCGCASGGNSNAPVRVDSKGHGDSVKQSNSVDSDATALNLNATKQDADQDQGGRGHDERQVCGCDGSDGIQAIGQESKSSQTAIALSAAIQLGASNSNTPVSVGGGKGHDDKDAKGHDGADHGGQGASCSGTCSGGQGGSCSGTCSGGQGGSCSGTCSGGQGGSCSGTCSGGQGGHDAKDSRGHKKEGSKKSHGKKGHGGSVWQSNHVDSSATAANLNATEQDADQDGSGIQAIGQEKHNAQAGLAFSLAAQLGAANRNP